MTTEVRKLKTENQKMALDRELAGPEAAACDRRAQA
jgi:hypothetical protein